MRFMHEDAHAERGVHADGPLGIYGRWLSKWRVKPQQMQRTPRGAHLLLQIRTRVLNEG
ncbi:MAG: hypothetical protein ACLQMO_15485 [Acidobacteriaceae bacterium]